MRRSFILALDATFAPRPFSSATPTPEPIYSNAETQFTFDYYVGHDCHGARQTIEGKENATCLRLYNAGSWMKKFIHEGCFVELYRDVECRFVLFEGGAKMQPEDVSSCQTGDAQAFRPWCKREEWCCSPY